MSIDAQALKIVEEALALDDAAARSAFVIRACAGDGPLEARVRELLAWEASEIRLLPTESFAQPIATIDDIPDRIGPYHVVGEIARGGMGAVVRAERADGVFAHTVAIKLIRGDLASDRARRRFADERRILGRLRHPGIVRILDGGDIDGRPWLAMDFIDGRPITQAVSAFTHSQRLDAFEAVCQAVAHAHRQLVIHADIKPSNVLMSDDGSVHLLDFGIARLIVDLDEHEAGDPYPLTKGYAAPERAVGVAPTIASDVFSLGVLLLGILGKTLPQDGEAFVTGTRLPVGQLEGDLAAIAARALADRPEDRYPDVPALLSDIHRHRHWIPVAARRDAGWLYHAGRFARRHAKGIALTAVAALALLAATAFSTMHYARAERARIEADRRFHELRRLADFMLVELVDRLSDAPGTVTARARLATVAGGYLDQLRAVPDAAADLRLDTARGYRRLAGLLGLSGTASLGRPADAARSLDHAEGLLQAVRRQRPNDPLILEELGWVALGRWTLMPDTAASRRGGEAACALFDDVLRRAPGRQGSLLGKLVCAKNKGYELIWSDDRPDEAVPVLRDALNRIRATRFEPAYRRDAALLEANILGRLGDAIYYAGHPRDALVPYRAQEALVRQWLRGGPSPVWIDKLAEAKFNISGTLGDLPGQTAVAEREAADGIDAVRTVLRFGVDANLEKRLLILLAQRALLLHDLGQRNEAVAVSRESIALRRNRLARAPSDPQRNRDLAVALPNHAMLLTAAGRRAEACNAAREAVTQWTALSRRGHLGAHDAANDVPAARDGVKKFCGRDIR